MEAGSRGYVLIVEDNPTDGAIVTAALEGKGWYVSLAEDAMQAVMLARRETPDALVLDIQMPGGSGVAALARLRGMPETADLPVFIVSGADPAKYEPAAAEHGYDAWFPKPVDLAALVEALSQVPGQHRESAPDLAPEPLNLYPDGPERGNRGGGHETPGG